MSSGPLPVILATAMLFPMGVALAAKPATRTESDAKKAESELQSVKSEIESITREVSGEQVERDRLTKELRSAEISVGKARENLESVRRERETIAREMGPALAAQQVAQANRPIVIINGPGGGGGVPFAPSQHLAELLNGGDRILAAVEPAADILGTADVDDEPEPSNDADRLPSWISRGTTTQDQASA